MNCRQAEHRRAEREQSARNDCGNVGGIPAEAQTRAPWKGPIPCCSLFQRRGRRAVARRRNTRAAEAEEPADRTTRQAFSCGAENDRASIYACQACNTDAAAGAMVRGRVLNSQPEFVTTEDTGEHRVEPGRYEL
jgi:hypothetical protein